MVRKIQKGSQKSRWRQIYIFFTKKSIGTPPIMYVCMYLFQNIARRHLKSVFAQ
jgi:hypothetical protein